MGVQLEKFAGGCSTFCGVTGWFIHSCVVNILQYTRGWVGGERLIEPLPKKFFKLRFPIGAFW